MQLNFAREIVREEWLLTPSIRQEIELDFFVIMPNHFHAVVCISSVGAHGMRPPHKRNLSSFVRGFKAAATGRINIARNSPDSPVWQRNYYDRIIRDKKELNYVHEYILSNPMNWDEDKDNVFFKKQSLLKTGAWHGPLRQTVETKFF